VVKLTVPHLNQLPNVLGEQFATLFPFGVERAYVRFRVLRQERQDGELECTVQVAACEQRALDDCLSILWGVGWGPSSVCPTALALVESVAAARLLNDEPAILLHLGQRSTTIMLTNHAEAVYARTIAVGSDHLTEALTLQIAVGSTAVQLSWGEAEALKRRVGFPNPQRSPREAEERIPLSTYSALVEPVLEQLMTEVKRTIAFGMQSALVAQPKRLILSGDGAELPHAEPWLADQLVLPVHRWQGDESLGSAGASSALVYGLALLKRPPSLDLLPKAFRSRRRLVRIAERIWQGLTMVAVVIFMGASWWVIRDQFVRGRLRDGEQHRMTLEPVIRVNEAISAETQLIQALVNDRGIAPAWFQRLAQGFPNPIRLTDVSVEVNGAVTMRGQAQTRRQTPDAYISELALWLQRSKICLDVHLDDQQRPTLGATEFSLTCHRP
jgi:Tfp pilus assembly PilM family ATPase